MKQKHMEPLDRPHLHFMAFFINLFRFFLIQGYQNTNQDTLKVLRSGGTMAVENKRLENMSWIFINSLTILVFIQILLHFICFFVLRLGVFFPLPIMSI
jgi:hypothetical protein